MRNRKADVSRRDFMRGAAAAGAAVGGLTILGGTARGQAKPLKAGLVGCGSRGRGALGNHVEAAQKLGVNVQFTALADAFTHDRMGQPILPAAQKLLKDKAGQSVPDSRCFVGFDAYKKVIDSGVDIVLLVTPPMFRPVQFAAAVAAGKHVFMEKPVAVDPVGAQAVLKAGEQADAKGLSVVAGTQRRHYYRYLQTYKLLQDGAIGPIRGGAVWWCSTQLWNAPRKPDWSPREYLVKNWLNFVQMSGDHIVEQHVHNIDVANWYLGTPPRLAVGFGARMRRKTGNQYDFFSVDYEYRPTDNSRERVRIHSMARQINGCWGREAEEFTGEKGLAGGTRIRRYDRERLKPPDIKGDRNPYVQEHIDLLKSITDKGEHLNETPHVAASTLTGIMGRISAYTGGAIRYSDVAEADGRFGKFAYKPGPLDFEKGEVEIPEEGVAPIPGEE